MTRSGKIFLLVTALIVIFSVLPAGRRVVAQPMDVRVIQELASYKNEMSDAAFAEQTESVVQTPKGDKFLAYEVKIPKGWKKHDENGVGDDDDDGLSRRVLGNVVRYYGPVRVDMPVPSRFEIQALELQYGMNARNWFLNHVMTSGFTLQGMKTVSDREVESQYVLIEGTDAFSVRTRAIINGSRMLLVSFYVPDSHWKKERALQERVVESFRFTSPEKSKVELTHTYTFLDLARFDYPDSWRLLTPNIYSTEGMDAKLLSSTNEKTLSGEINIHIVSTSLETTLSQEVQYVKNELKETGFSVGELIEVPTAYKFDGSIYFSRVEVYKTTEDKKMHTDHEFWIAVMAEDRYYYIVTMLSPGRASDFYTWARNTEAFKTVAESVRP